MTPHSTAGDIFGIGKIMNSIKENTKEALLECKPQELIDNAEEKL